MPQWVWDLANSPVAWAFLLVILTLMAFGLGRISGVRSKTLGRTMVSQFQINAIISELMLFILALVLIYLLHHQIAAGEKTGRTYITELVAGIIWSIHKIGDIAKQFAEQGYENNHKKKGTED